MVERKKAANKEMFKHVSEEATTKCKRLKKFAKKVVDGAMKDM